MVYEKDDLSGKFIIKDNIIEEASYLGNIDQEYIYC